MTKLPILPMVATLMLTPWCARSDPVSPAIQQRSVVKVTDFGVKPNIGADATFGVFRALEACRAAENPVLIFPRGTYQFYPDEARARYYSIANNWHKMQRVALPLWNFEGITIDGPGSDFIMHGTILPVAMDGATNVTIKNFSIDWQRRR